MLVGAVEGSLPAVERLVGALTAAARGFEAAPDPVKRWVFEVAAIVGAAGPAAAVIGRLRARSES